MVIFRPGGHEKGHNSETKSRKIVRRCQNDCNDECFKRSIDKNRGPISKKRIFRPKYCIFGPKICFFLRYAHIINFFALWKTRLNGIISSSCPQVTLDTFGFLVGARWAARRAVFWPRLPKMALFGAKNGIFWPQEAAPAPTVRRFQNENLAHMVSRHDGDKKIGICPNNMASGPKNTVFLAKKSVFSYATPM